MATEPSQASRSLWDDFNELNLPEIKLSQKGAFIQKLTHYIKEQNSEQIQYLIKQDQNLANAIFYELLFDSIVAENKKRKSMFHQNVQIMEKIVKYNLKYQNSIRESYQRFLSFTRGKNPYRSEKYPIEQVINIYLQADQLYYWELYDRASPVVDLFLQKSQILSLDRGAAEAHHYKALLLSKKVLNSDSCFEHMMTGSKISATLGNIHSRVRNLNLFSDCLYTTLMTDIDYSMGYKTALQYAQKHGDEKLVAETLHILASPPRAYYNIEQLKKAIQIAQKIQDFELKAQIKLSLGKAYVGHERYYKARKLFAEIISYYQKKKDEFGLLKAYEAYGDSYNYILQHSDMQLPDHAQGRQYYLKSLNIAQNMNHPEWIAYYQKKIGDTYIQEQNPELAAHWFKKSKTNYAQTSNKKETAQSHLDYAISLYRKGDKEKAKIHFLQLIKSDNYGIHYELRQSIKIFFGQKIVLDILPFLNQKNRNIQTLVIDILGDLAVPDTFKYLIPFLNDKNRFVRHTAMLAMKNFGNQLHPSNYILPLLKNDESRWEAKEILTSLDDKMIVPELLTYLQEPDESVRYYAVMVLEKIGDKSHLHHIVPLLKDESPHVRAEVINAIRIFGDKSHLDKLMPFVGDKDSYIQNNVFAILEKEANDELLLSLLKHPNPTTRQNAMDAIYHRSKKINPEFYLLLQDEDVWVQLKAINLVSSSNSPDILKLLTPLLQDNDASVRITVLQKLDHLKGKECLPEVKPLIEDNDPKVRMEAVSILKKYGALPPHEFDLELLYTSLQSDAPQTQFHAFTELIKLEKSESLPHIFAFLEKGNLDAHQVINANLDSFISIFGDKNIIPKILPYLVNKNDNVRNIAAKFVVKYGDASLTHTLIANLKHEDEAVQATNIYVLGIIGNRDENQMLLLPFLKSHSSQVKLNVLNTILYPTTEKRTTFLLLKLLPLMEDDNSEVRSQVLNVLINARDPALQSPLIEKYIFHPETLVRAQATNILRYLYRRLAPNQIDLSYKKDLWKLLYEPHVKVKRNLPELFQHLNKTGSLVSDILPFLRDKNIFAQENALNILPLLLDRDEKAKSEVTQAIIPFLKHPSPYIRKAASNSLVIIDNPTVLVHLMPLIKDKDPYVRANAVWGVAKWGEPSMVPEIIHLLKDQDYWVREKMLLALKNLGDKSILKDIYPVLKEHDNDSSKQIVIETIEKYGDQSSIPVLVEFMNQRYYQSLRKQALYTIYKLGGASSTRYIQPFVKDRDGYIAQEATKIIEMINNKKERQKSE